MGEPEPDGVLHIVGTPIGNLGDLTLRAIDVLRSADAVVCEDTRRTGKLLAHLRSLDLGPDHAADPDRPRPDLLVANQHTEVPRIGEVLDRLARGQRLALVTDAGMPTVSDPGAAIIAAAIEAGHRVEIVPGPTAASAGLALSGFGGAPFVFEGFLPRSGKGRADRLAALATETRTIVVYEAPHRLTATLADLAGTLGGDRRVAVARELTKLHEEVRRGSLAELAEHYRLHEPRGEFVVVVDGRADQLAPAADDELVERLRAAIDRGLTKRDAVAEVVSATGAPKRRVYDLSIRL